MEEMSDSGWRENSGSEPCEIKATEVEAPTFDDGYEIRYVESYRKRDQVENRYSRKSWVVEAGSASHKPQKCESKQAEPPTFENGIRFYFPSSFRICVQIENRYSRT